jgi:polyphenol oxidase
MRARWGFTTKADGSFAIPVEGQTSEITAHAARWRSVTGAETTWLRQEHGTTVVHVTRPGEHVGAVADASVTDVPHAALSVITADCAPVVFIGMRSVGVAHAGWKGLTAGILENTAAALFSMGESPQTLSAYIGPCISASRYEFGSDDLATVAAQLGNTVRSVDVDGRPALDIAAAVRAALAHVDVTLVAGPDGCTATDAHTWWSWRARREHQRQGAWIVLDGTDCPDGTDDFGRHR